MQTTFSRIATALLPGFFAFLVILAVAGEAQGSPTTTSGANTTAMGQSIRTQLDGGTYQFAIATSGRLDLTGHNGVVSPAEAVDSLRNGAPGGDTTSCHVEFDTGVEAVLIVTDAPAGVGQPCGVLGIAHDAAA